MAAINFQTYKAVGEQDVSPGGRSYYRPDCDNSIKPVVGMIFDFIDHAFAFYQKYALSCGFSVRKNMGYKPGGITTLKYFVCTREGFREEKVVNTKGDENKIRQRRRKPSKRCGCNAHMKLRITSDKKYVIYFFEELHNHSFVGKEDVHFLSAARRVDHVKESAIQSLSSINLGPVRAFNILKTLYGGYAEVGATKADFKNYKRDLNEYIGEYDAEMIVQRLTKKKEHLPNFTFEYTLKDDRSLGSLFWADEVSKINYSIFGDVVAFDATYRTNRYDMVFVPFTGIDNHNRNVTFGAALLGSETADSYRWLLGKFLDAFGSPPKVVVTDQDLAMKRAILDVFPSSRHRLCMWHIWEKFTSKVGAAKCNIADFKKKLCGIVWTDSITIEEFEKLWHSILCEFGCSDHVWLGDIYRIRNDWIPAFYKDEDLSGLMRTTSRAESENHFFNQFCNPKSTFMEFYTHFESAMEAQRYEHRKNDHETRYTDHEIWSSFPLEKQAAQIFTQTIFLDQQLEIDDAINSCASATIEKIDDGFESYSIKDLSDPCAAYFNVMFRKVDLTIFCSCGRFKQFGLICRHIYYVLRLCGITEFPKKYVLRRWIREAVPNISLQSVISSSKDDVADVEAIVREIMVSNEYVINRLVMNKDELCLYRDHVKGYMCKADEIQIVAPRPSRRDKFASVTGMSEPRNATVRVPVRTRTKGCGTNKRLKSAREIAINTSNLKKKARGCGLCKGVGHNQRTCPLASNSVEGKVGSSSSGHT